VVGHGRKFRRHEEVASHPPHGFENSLSKGVLANLLAHEVGLKSNHLDHVPAQDGEVRFRHRLHVGRSSIELIRTRHAILRRLRARANPVPQPGTACVSDEWASQCFL